METSAVPLPQVTIIWLPVLLLATLCAAQETLHIMNLDCYNDYVTEMFCTWKASDANRNCSDDFLLEYNLEGRTSSCVPENAPLSDSGSRNECICYISAEYFVANDVYYIQVKSGGESIQNTTIVPADKVKPKTPSNVTIKHGEDETRIVCWESGYTIEDYLFQQLTFEIQTSTIQEPKEVKVTTLHQVESCYILKERLLRRRQDYIIKVRSKPNGIGYHGVWSEWSSGAVWHNDYNLPIHDILVISIPSSAAVVFLCILMCSASAYLCKKKWLNTIPDPGKSQLLFPMMNKSQVSVLKSNKNCKILSFVEKRKQERNIRAGWLKLLISRNQDETEQNSANLQTAAYQKLPERAEAMTKFIVIPEITPVEKLIVISPLTDDMNSVNEPADDEEADEVRDHRRECDGINKMFLEILQSDTVTDDTGSSEKQNQITFSFLEDFSSLQDLVHTRYTHGNLLGNSSQISCGEQEDIVGYTPAIVTSYTTAKNCGIDMDCTLHEQDSDEPKCPKSIRGGSVIYHMVEPLTYMPNTCNKPRHKKLFSNRHHLVRQNKTTNSTAACPRLYLVPDYQSCVTANKQPGENLTHTGYTSIRCGYEPAENLSRTDSRYHIHDAETLPIFSAMRDDTDVRTNSENTLVEGCLTDVCEDKAIGRDRPTFTEDLWGKPDPNPRTVLQDEPFLTIPYALTFDISAHMRNLHQISGQKLCLTKL